METPHNILTQLLEYDKIISDGDLDGVTAVAILNQYVKQYDAEFPPPPKLRGLKVDNTILVELPPSKGLIYGDNVLLIDHHGDYKGFYKCSGENCKQILEVDGRSVAEIIVKALNIHLPEKYNELLEFVNKVDSDPNSVAGDPRYIGYRTLIRDPTWRILASKSLDDLALVVENFFKPVGETILKYEQKPELVEELVKTSEEEIGGYKIGVVWKNKDEIITKKVVEEGREYTLTANITDYVIQKKMMELENNHDIVLKVTSDPKTPGKTGVTIWVNTKKGLNAGELAKKVAEKLGGTGGGKDFIAGAQLDIPYQKEATIKKILETLKEILEPQPSPAPTQLTTPL